MSIKKTVIALSLLAITNVSYAVGTIRFLGEVSDQTCSVEVEGATGDLNILLDPVTVTELTNAGINSPVAARDFSARIYDCDTTPSSAGLKLVPTQTNSDDGTYLANTIDSASGGATNVAFRLYDAAGATGNVLDFTSGAAYVTSTWTTGATEMTVDMSVAYVMTAATPTTGQVQSDVQYTVTYY